MSSALRIEDHGLIGDMRTAGLVGLDGSIDFMCWPRFDSPSIFARLLDDDGGTFVIGPDEPVSRRVQIYLPDTNVLVTRFLSHTGVLEVIDFMTPEPKGRLARCASVVKGCMKVRLRCAPRFDYAREVPEPAETNQGVRFRADGLDLRLFGERDLTLEDGAAHASFELQSGERASFVLQEHGDEVPHDVGEWWQENFDRTVRYWRGWIERSTYGGRWRETVLRSALALKLMTFSDTGAIVAAPTFGLPEEIGGERNWDYRYCWLRDAAFTVYGLTRVGFYEETLAFITWLTHRAQAADEEGRLHVLYDVDGGQELKESTLDHMEGYRGSTPVRIGNNAFDQLQLDVYGELMDAIYIAAKRTGMIDKVAWSKLCRMMEWLCGAWEQPDEGIWEVRSERREFLSSRLMCWVAFDRAIRLARKLSLPGPIEHWRDVRDTIHDQILDDFFDEEIGAFVQHKGAKHVDGSVLLMPLVKFINPTDPLWVSTMERVEEELVWDCLVKRYAEPDDGLSGKEATFTICAFWYVENLARMGRTEEARLLFDKLLSYGNHLDLFSEELALDGAHLGNFPQALTHLSLISAATYLDRVLGGRNIRAGLLQERGDASGDDG